VWRKRRGGSLFLLLGLKLKGISKGSICKRFWGVFTKLDDLQEGLIHALGRGGVAVEPSS
jgi:hypothetical protein